LAVGRTETKILPIIQASVLDHQEIGEAAIGRLKGHLNKGALENHVMRPERSDIAQYRLGMSRISASALTDTEQRHDHMFMRDPREGSGNIQVSPKGLERGVCIVAVAAFHRVIHATDKHGAALSIKPEKEGNIRLA